jgi:hypothetical protein
MRKINYNPDTFSNEKSPLRWFLNHDYDSYWEYYDFMHPISEGEKKFYQQSWVSLCDSSYHLIKQELEYIFERREEVTVDELIDYMWRHWREKTVKKHISFFLAIYYDYYKEDEEFDKELYEATKEYFWINEEEIEKTRV